MSNFRFPTASERVSVVGRTGSGKTLMGGWLLSEADFHKRPWIVIDFKGDQLINAIPGAHHIDTGDKLPKKPGIYVMHAHPTDEEGIEKKLLEIWEQENTGLWIDEAYMIPRNSPSFGGILTQGRSKKISTITLSQRPSWLSKFVFSEADHFSVFHLNDKNDRKKVSEFLPEEVDLSRNPAEFHSYWYDVKKNKSFLMRPVPDSGMILARFDFRQPKKRTFFY